MVLSVIAVQSSITPLPYTEVYAFCNGQHLDAQNHIITQLCHLTTTYLKKSLNFLS